MFLKKFLRKMMMSFLSNDLKNTSKKSQKSFLYKQIYKYMFVKKVLENKYFFLNSQTTNENLIMNNSNFTQEDEKRELIALLNEGYETLSNIYLGENNIKSIQDLSDEEAINVIQWINKFFIDGFERLEEYEKCSLLKEFSDKIKDVKQLKID